MWNLFLFSVLPILLNVPLLYCHIPSYASTPSNKIDQFCVMAETCVHDTIPICGQMASEKRTFLDLCDLLEYACDTNQIFTHIEDQPGCPEIKRPQK